MIGLTSGHKAREGAHAIHCMNGQDLEADGSET